MFYISLKIKSLSLKQNIVNLFCVVLLEQVPIKSGEFRFFFSFWGAAPKVPPQNKLTKFYFNGKDLIFKLI